MTASDDNGAQASTTHQATTTSAVSCASDKTPWESTVVILQLDRSPSTSPISKTTQILTLTNETPPDMSSEPKDQGSHSAPNISLASRKVTPTTDAANKLSAMKISGDASGTAKQKKKKKKKTITPMFYIFSDDSSEDEEVPKPTLAYTRLPRDLDNWMTKEEFEEKVAKGYTLAMLAKTAVARKIAGESA
ncbi:uncharacterized protein HMPREF1541_08295 [Cyphellophora europaea CBS 101466]|uniref:Uncharacterized protein n=1 Tax=Cyphellophora europaea (strain CBS 101466) TaxID=1220924 RepID=W2RNJ6_CYPE1|nr:uncharacterized protein HMPREF1541_08295 [Cyphellophora europaea CBS 101466]ETN37304.1 hypothetical protein HMPREF1541_08295 [Cyphellophora europaea CBS 101466]